MHFMKDNLETCNQDQEDKKEHEIGKKIFEKKFLTNIHEENCYENHCEYRIKFNNIGEDSVKSRTSDIIKIDKNKVKRFKEYCWTIDSNGSLIAKYCYPELTSKLSTVMITRILFKEEIEELYAKYNVYPNTIKVIKKGGNNKEKRNKANEHSRTILNIVALHKNGDKLDNRRSNLDFIPKSQASIDINKRNKIQNQKPIILPDGREKRILGLTEYETNKQNKIKVQKNKKYEIRIQKNNKKIYLTKEKNVIQAVWGILLLRFVFFGEEYDLITFAKEEGVEKNNIKLIKQFLKKYLITKEEKDIENIKDILKEINIDKNITKKIGKKIKENAELVYKHN